MKEETVQDRQIIELFWERSQQALTLVQTRYGEKLRRVAENVVHNGLDAEECVSDTLLTAWNSIPPARPDPLLPWLYRTVRHIALRRYHHETAKKRGGGEFPLVFEEISELVGQTGEGERSRPDALLDAKELGKVINQFVAGLSKRDRILFLGRYWYGEAYDTLALRLNMTENNCMVRISRLRRKLKKTLQEKGVL